MKKQKSEKQKEGERQVLLLNEMFPDLPLNQIISTVKSSKLDFDLAVQTLLSQNNKSSSINNNNDHKYSNENATKVVTVTRKFEAKPSDVKQIKSIVPHLTDAVIIKSLEQNNGDVDVTILTLLNSTPAVSPALQAQIEKIKSIATDLDDQTIIQAINDAEGDDDLALLNLLNRGSDSSITTTNVSTTSPKVNSEEEDEAEEENDSEEEDNYFYEKDDLPQDEENVDVDGWFISPEKERERELQKKYIESLEREMQLQKDEEYARTLQIVEQYQQENDRYRIHQEPINEHIGRIDPSVFGRHSRQSTNQNDYPRPSVTIVPPDAKLQHFLNVIKEREVLEMTNSIPKKAFQSYGKRLSEIIKEFKHKREQFKQPHRLPWEKVEEVTVSEDKTNIQLNLVATTPTENNNTTPQFTNYLDCIEIQYRELEALKAFFMENFSESDSFPKRFSIQIIQSISKAAILFITTIPVKYPFELPSVVIHTNSLFQLQSLHRKQLETFMENQFKGMLGTMMLLPFFTEAVRWVDQIPSSAADVDLQGDHYNSLKWILSSNFEVLTPQMIIQKQIDQTLITSQRFSVSKHLSRVMLTKFKWNSEKASEKYMNHMENQTLNDFYAEIGAPPSNPDVQDVDFEKTYECPSCFDDFPLNEVVGLACRHFYCKNCFENYLKIKIMEGGVVEGITCPAFKCKYIVDEVTVASLCDSDTYNKYTTFLTKAFIDTQSNAKWCPGKRCDNAIMTKFKYAMVQCNCGLVFCFNCGLEGHWPATCGQITWYNKTHDRKVGDADASEKTLEWISKYTQDCPKCRAPIEKNGGCNHMKCSSCKYEYCWVCLGEWTGGTHYNCSSPASNTAEDRDIYKRFAVNNLSFNQLSLIQEKAKRHDDTRIKLLAEERMKQSFYAQSESSIEQCEIICQAVEHIFLCRHIIINLCIMGQYYLAQKLGGGKKLKFWIEKLHSNINLLSSFIDIPKNKHLDFKAIRDFTTAVRTGLQNLQSNITDILPPAKSKSKESNKC